MTQQRLKLRTSRAESVARQRVGMERSNAVAAAVILERPESFGGPGSLAVEWARRFMERVKAEQRAALIVRYHDWQKQAEASLAKMSQGGKTAGRGRPRIEKGSLISGNPIGNRERSQYTDALLAKQANVARHKIDQAISVAKADPELLTEVIAGKTKLTTEIRQSSVRTGKDGPETFLRDCGLFQEPEAIQ